MGSLAMRADDTTRAPFGLRKIITDRRLGRATSLRLLGARLRTLAAAEIPEVLCGRGQVAVRAVLDFF